MTTNDDTPYRHKEPTILIELEERYAKTLMGFFDSVLEQWGTRTEPVALNYDNNIINISDEWLKVRYGTYWDLYDDVLDLNNFTEALQEALDRNTLSS